MIIYYLFILNHILDKIMKFQIYKLTMKESKTYRVYMNLYSV